jgi:mannose-6-phosphate isomerase-like protein (cupin superfamily)
MVYQIVRKGEKVHPDLENHGGIGSIAIQRYFGKQLPWPVDVEIWDIPSGCAEGMHVHDESDLKYGSMTEVYLILEGTAEMTIDGHLEAFSRGDAILCSGGSQHNFVNTGPDNLKVLFLSNADRD